MIPGFTEAVNMKNKQLKDQRKYEAVQKAKYRMRIPFLEPDVKFLLPVRFEASNRKSLIKKQEGGSIEKADNTRVLKPIPGIISPDSEVRTYDNIPVRVSKHYPWQDKYYLGNPARPMYSHDKNVKLNGIYPSVYGVELDVLAPEYIQKINGNDTTYYVQGGDENYYPVAGQLRRPAFREAFKSPKVRGNRPNYFDTPEKIDKLKQVIANWQK